MWHLELPEMSAEVEAVVVAPFNFSPVLGGKRLLPPPYRGGNQ